MPRRTWKQVTKGQVYAVEWPEWHVECAEDGCDKTILVSPTGECGNARDANKLMKKKDTEDTSIGWNEKGGLWYCPDHSE